MNETYIGDVVNKEERLCFRYTELDAKTHCIVLVEKEEVSIKRDGETKSKITLRLGQKTKAKIITPYGNMDMVVLAKKIERKEHGLHVVYSIVDGKEVIDTIDISWDIKKDAIS